jgi:lipopolysaccharide transport system ATP-binding protein
MRQQMGTLLADQIAAVLARPIRRAAVRLQGRKPRSVTLPRNGHFWALQDVSFDVQSGEAIGIIGRNGAGKSTILKILSRITKPTTGRVDLYGRVGSLLEVGTGFHSELTGRENIYLNGAILGMRRAEITRKFDEIVAFAEVPEFIDTQVKHYSSGMYMRLAFAVAAHLDTEILLVDEVLAVGDAAFQKKCLGKMSDVTKAGRTVLFVSHDLTAIQALCTRAIRLSGGRISGMGPVADEVASYLAQNRGEMRNDLDHPIELSPRTQLVRLSFSPNPVITGQPLELNLELQSSRAMRIDDLAVIIFDALNRRVALIDLRRAEGALKTNGHDNLRLRAALQSLPLTEGEYRIGMWIRCDDTSRAHNDLLMLDVVSDIGPGDFVPYHAMARGVVALDYTVDRQD